MAPPRRAGHRPRHRRSPVHFLVVAAAFGLAIAACGRSVPPAPDAGRAAQVVAGPHDGSLGDENSRRACTLLDAAEIEAQFGGPVGEATPIYPYCQWIVGEDQSAFVAVTIIPVPIADARGVHTVRAEVDGIGEDAYIASTRAMIFGQGGTTFSILWQKVGDFTTVETERMRALALNLLARV